jgi:crotonobetainyl-CoA:carnitine CoA-transferase CaiB-like acyl-CoA transferase
VTQLPRAEFAATEFALSGLRVLDLSTEIAGPYCTKLLADAGADVVKVEAVPDGDPMRGWRSGALFEFLNTTKRSVTGDWRVLAAAVDILVVDGGIPVDALRDDNPALVVVTLSPFGLDGPWADRAATEFTLQAWCGSTGSRGLPEQPPLAAGGRIGEWLTGSFAAVAALAAVRDARRSGRGAHIDVATLDCMAVTMVSYPTVHAAMAGWPEERGPSRVVEIPSVEPTADGYVVVTTNSAQQYNDFLVQIGRADVLEDMPELAQRQPRWERRDEFNAIVHEYTLKRSTEQVLEDAELLRVPCAPVHNGATLPKVDHFVERGVYVPSPSGRFVQPRIPYTIGNHERRPFAPAPAVGEHTGAIAWEPRPARAGGTPRRPLEGLRVVDCTAWWAGPAATHVLAALGADVIKVESVSRPDLMRYTALRPPSAEQWWEWGGLFHGVNSGKRGITLDLRTEEGIGLFHQLLDTADALLDNYTPRVMEQFGLTWDLVHERHPRLVMTRMPAFGLDGPWRDRTGFAQQMEGISGMAWLTGYPDGLPVLVRGACDPLAALHAVLATLAALEIRDRTGEGVFVESTMIETALNVAAEQVIDYCVSGEVLHRAGARGPTAAPQGVYQCTGDDRWVAIAIATDNQWDALRGALGDPEWARSESLATVDGRRAAHDAIDAQLAAYCATRDADDVVELLWSAGVPVGDVVRPREILYNPQLRHRGLFETEDHPVTGKTELPMMPFRFDTVDAWMTRPSPTLGQHNDEVLAELGVDANTRAALRAAGLIGDRPAGA